MYIRKSLDNEYVLIILSVLFVSIPVTYITGPFLPDLTISLISILGLLYLYKNNLIIHLFKNRITYLFAIIYFYFIFTSLLSSNILLSFESTLFYFRFFIFSLVVFYLYIKNENQIINFLFYSLSLTFACIILASLYEMIFGFSIFNICKGYVFYSKPLNRISSLFCDELITGIYLSRLFPIYLYTIFKKIEKGSIKINKNFICFVALFFCIFIFFTGERSAFAISILQLFLITFFLNKKYLLIFLIFFFTFFNAISLIQNEKIQSYKVRMINTMLNTVNLVNDNPYIFTPGHTELYNGALKLYLTKPIFGIGPKLFREECKKYGTKCSTHPHNYYIQLLTETGLIGFLSLFSFFIFITINLTRSIVSKKRSDQTDSKFFIYLFFFVVFFPLMPTGSIFNNYNAIVLFLPVGILISLHKEKLFKIN